MAAENRAGTTQADMKMEFLQESHEVKRKKLKPGAGWGVGMGVGALLPVDFTQFSQHVRPPYRGNLSPLMIGGLAP